ncbi:ANKH [Bugula neritina]|uniref:ANKH n=1 Tax=Bugula neritina TaxID=10212 RepID=A0A7J7KR18_BUGNE|nr:ANKH [Bugula neritina]
MVTLLASYGLAAYVTRIFAANSMELRNISIVLVNTKRDNFKMTIFSLVIGTILSVMLLIIGLTPLGTWLIRDVHRQSQEVSDTTCSIIAYLSITPLIEAAAYYYEGGLIYHKLTVYAGAAKFADFLMQVIFVIGLLFTPTRTEPVLVPVSALYAGLIARLILAVGFWYVFARDKLPVTSSREKPLTVGQGICFWFPLTLVRLAQVLGRPIINLVVSRNLAVNVSEEAAAQAVAVLTAVYPTSRVFFSWLTDLRTVVPTFHKQTDMHPKFKMKFLTLYATSCTLLVFLINIILFITPGVAYGIMTKVVVGMRSHLSGILLAKKKTIYLTPSAIFRFLSILLALATVPKLGLSGANLGVTCLEFSFAVELFFVALACVLVKLKPDLDITSCWKRNKPKPEDVTLMEAAAAVNPNDSSNNTGAPHAPP